MGHGIRTKLGFTIASLLVAIVLLGGVSFAWYTINTKADIGDMAITFKGLKWPFEAGYETGTGELDESGNEKTTIVWAKELNVSAYMKKLELDQCQLRPISTYDLQHWYNSSYAANGDVNGFIEVQLNAIANQKSAEDNGQDFSAGSVIYFDLWVRETNDGEQAGLKLSTVEPYLSSDGVVLFGDTIVSESVEGTFVLTKPSIDKSTGKYAYEVSGTEYLLTEDDRNKDALNCIRIGFAALDDSGNVESYFIYEPNADKHSEEAHYSYTESGDANYDSRTDETHYILKDLVDVTSGNEVKDYNPDIGSTVDEDSETQSLRQYRSNVTLVAQAENGERVKIVNDATGVSGQEYDLLYTYVPKMVKEGETEKVELHPQVTVRQLGSEWNMQKVSTKDGSTATNALDSTCIKSFGQFIDEAPALCTIKNGEPKKIRVFFWLEGQDVDCWNEILGGALFANLEFTGIEITDAKTPAADSGD